MAMLLAGWQSPAAEPNREQEKVAEPKAAKGISEHFLRIERNAKDQPLGLQTAIVRYVPAGDDRAGLTVDLIGAVHVGEKAYYESLNEAFKEYDAVLYELVAPPGTRIPKGAKAGKSLVSSMQNVLKDLLQLEHQLEHVDYTKENLVHADMSGEQFAKSMQDRGESFWTMFIRLMSKSMAMQAKRPGGGASEFELLFALFDPNKAITVKRIMAEQFDQMDGLMEAFNGPDGSTIITERNKVALAELSKQIAAGKKHLAVFYGAGHLPDMQKRLLEEFKLKRSQERWLTAWNLTEKPAAPVKPRVPAKQPAAVE